MKYSQPTVILLTGPTAVGKTELCIRLAETLGTEIISADSRQFYKELTIGTAKPTASQLARVKHHFINTHHIDVLYGAGHFERDALNKLEEIFTRLPFVIVTGGSGMYIKALLEGMDEFPEIPVALRSNLNSKFIEKGKPWLIQELQRLDPSILETIDQNNTQRLLRALEIIIHTGQSIQTFRQGRKKPRPFRTIKIILQREREELYSRINQRVDEMIQEGLIEEVNNLTSFRKHNALKTVGYSEIFNYLDGVYDLEKAIDSIKQNTRHYAKRQMTWFRHQMAADYFHPEDPQKILSHLLKQINS